MYVAPARAAIAACAAEKHSVKLVLIPCSDRSLQAIRPSLVRGSLIVISSPIAMYC